MLFTWSKADVWESFWNRKKPIEFPWKLFFSFLSIFFLPYNLAGRVVLIVVVVVLHSLPFCAQLPKKQSQTKTPTTTDHIYSKYFFSCVMLVLQLNITDVSAAVQGNMFLLSHGFWLEDYVFPEHCLILVVWKI